MARSTETAFTGSEDRSATSAVMGWQHAPILPVSLAEFQARVIYYEALDARAFPSTTRRGPSFLLLEDQNGREKKNVDKNYNA